MDVTTHVYELVELHSNTTLYMVRLPGRTFATTIYCSPLGMFHIVHRLPLTLTRCDYAGKRIWT